MWNKYHIKNDNIPELYEALGMQVSKPVLTYNKFTRICVIATFWLTPDKEVWRDNEVGGIITITHWQEINLPKD